VRLGSVRAELLDVGIGCFEPGATDSSAVKLLGREVEVASGTLVQRGVTVEGTPAEVSRRRPREESRPDMVKFGDEGCAKLEGEQCLQGHHEDGHPREETEVHEHVPVLESEADKLGEGVAGWSSYTLMRPLTLVVTFVPEPR